MIVPVRTIAALHQSNDSTMINLASRLDRWWGWAMGLDLVGFFAFGAAFFFGLPTAYLAAIAMQQPWLLLLLPAGEAIVVFVLVLCAHLVEKKYNALHDQAKNLLGTCK